MADFILKPRFYDRLPEYLLGAVPGFGDSPEMAAIAGLQDLPGVVSGALGGFLARLQRESGEGRGGEVEARQLASAYQAIEEMARSEDPEVPNALQVEIFEILNDGSTLWETIKGNLLPASRELLEELERLRRGTPWA
jgi:hypothetical protein